MRRFMEAATRIAVILDNPAYDCVYLAQAEPEDAIFITADERLLRKVRSEAASRFSARVLGLAEAVTPR